MVIARTDNERREPLLSPIVKRLLLAVIFAGLAGSVPEVIFNFYVQSLGYDNAVAGQLASVVRFAGFAFGVPIGLMVDRFGGIRAIQLGATLNVIVWLVMLQTTDINTMRAFYLLSGVLATSVMVGSVPTLVRVVSLEQRAQILGINFSIFMIMGFVGALVGGFLPSIVASIQGIDATSVAAYRAVLYVPVICSTAVVVVLIGLHARITQHNGQNKPAEVTGQPTDSVKIPFIMLLTLGNFMMGFAGGILHPFMNLMLRQRFSLEDGMVGVLIAVLSLLLGLGGLFGRPIANRFGARKGIIILTLLAAITGACTLSDMLWLSFTGYAISTFLIGMAFPFFDLLLIASVAPQQRGITKSISSMQWSLGWSLAALYSGYLQVEYGFVVPILIFAIGQAVAAVIVLFLPYRDQPSTRALA
ncbi:MAG: MFS transporter [Roseiflexaceae bacterium]